MRPIPNSRAFGWLIATAGIAVCFDIYTKGHARYVFQQPRAGVMIWLVWILIFAWFVWDANRQQLWRVAPLWLGLIVGGVLGNLVDCLTYGSVRDWLRLGPWLTNVADLAIGLGAAGFAYVVWQNFQEK